MLSFEMNASVVQKDDLLANILCSEDEESFLPVVWKVIGIMPDSKGYRYKLQSRPGECVSGHAFVRGERLVLASEAYEFALLFLLKRVDIIKRKIGLRDEKDPISKGWQA